MTDKWKLYRIASSGLAIGVGTAFIAFATLLSLTDPSSDHGAGWRLRGTIAPDTATKTSTRLPAVSKRA